MGHSKVIGALGVSGLLLVSGLLGPPRPSWASQSMATIDTALADAAHLVHRPWRGELASALHALPEWRQTRTVGSSVRGKVIAGTVRLPAKVEVTGDTTIVADVIELTAGSVLIRADGYDVNVLPVTAVRRNATGAATASVFTIDTSSSNSGSTGFTGSPGSSGSHGNDGNNASSDPNNCNNLNGGNGGAGGDSSGVGAGGAGGQGGDAGGISFAIPDGSQDFYMFIARGAQGGTGGPGGTGGDGGDGGNGGNGAFGYYECGGNGGAGGNGGKGGNSTGGDGGKGGSGGKGGDANISYPPGYDRSKATFDLRGGDGGGGGSPGFSGTPGTGGSGGTGGDGVFSRGNDGSPGGGGIQKIGSTGGSGSAGGNGTVTDSPIVTVSTDKAAYLVGESPTYTVTGAPNSEIFWTSTLNGAVTEDHVSHGDFTNASGRATITRGAWTEADVGSWMKQVTIAGVDGRVFFEVRMSGPWSAWTSLGGVLTERVGAVARDTGVTAFGRGTDNGLYVNELNGSTWTGWRGLGGSLTSRPVPAGQYDVYARGDDGSVVHGTFLPSYPPVWESLGGYIIGTPTVTSYRCPAWESPLQRCTMVLARGGDNALYVNRQRGPYDPTWTGWEYLGGTVTADPVAIYRLGRTVSVDVERQIQVFVRNGAGGLSTRLYNGTSWEGWQDLGGGLQGSPEAVAAVNYNMGFVPYTFVFIRGTDDALWVNRMDNGVWTGWQSLGGVLRSDPVAVAPFLRNDTAVYVSVRGTDDGFHIASWTRPGGWAGWRSVAGSSVLAPEVVSSGNVPQLLGVDKNNGRGYYRVVFDN